MDYCELVDKIQQLKKNYKVRVIGKSLFGKRIFAVEKVIEKSLPTAIFIASIHARENITTELLIKMLEEELFSEIEDFNLSFILMANPDGVEICYNGFAKIHKKYLKNIRKINCTNACLWKANGRGVDLNNNFDAGFGTNVYEKRPASSGFPGRFAGSEPETRAIVNYTLDIKPFFTVSYHTKGEEIYYNFFQSGRDLTRDTLIAERFAKSTGYAIKNVENVSSGGYKDWCVQKLKIPALTIEVGSDNLVHPITRESLDEIFERNKNVAKDVQFAYNVFCNKGEINGI